MKYTVIRVSSAGAQFTIPKKKSLRDDKDASPRFAFKAYSNQVISFVHQTAIIHLNNNNNLY